MIQTLDIIQFFLDKPESKSSPCAFQCLKLFCAKNGTNSCLFLENNLTTIQKSNILTLLEIPLKASPIVFGKVEVLIDLISLLSKSGKIIFSNNSDAVRDDILNNFGMEFFLKLYNSSYQEPLQKSILKLLSILIETGIFILIL